MPLAQGTLPGTQGPIYTAPPGGKVITSIELANDSTGTGTCTINLFIRRKGRDAKRILPLNTQIAVEEVITEEKVRRLNEGDQIEGSSTDADDIDFTIEGG